MSARATGGLGTLYEYRVGAEALSALICEDSLSGTGGAAVTQVAFQQRDAGARFDDLIVRADQAGFPRALEISVKSAMKLVTSDVDFVATVALMLEAVDEDRVAFEMGSRALGLVLGERVRGAVDLGELTRLARASESHEGFADLLEEPSPGQPGAVRQSVRRRWHQLVAAARQTDWATATETLEKRLFRVMRTLWVRQLDMTADEPGHGEAVRRLRQLFPDRSNQAARQLFDELVAIAEELGPLAGAVSVAGLRARLHRRQVSLSRQAGGAAAWALLERATADTLSRGPDEIAGRIMLARSELLQELDNAANGGNPVVHVVGVAGAGKSVALRRQARIWVSAGWEVVALDLGDLPGDPISFEHHLGAPVREVLAGARTGTARVLLLDGADRIQSDGQSLIRSLLHATRESDDFVPWVTFLVMREEALPIVQRTLREVRPDAQPKSVVIPELREDEIDQVTNEVPVLSRVAGDPRSRRLLGRPFVADVLARAGTQELPERSLGEVDVADIVWVHLVRSAAGRGTPDGREDAALTLADAALAGRLPGRVRVSEPGALAGLRADGLLIRDAGLDRFAHDVFRDYAVAQRLREPARDASLRAAPAPRLFLRSARLALAMRLQAALERDDWLDTWESTIDVVAMLADQDGRRWSDLPVEALLELGEPNSALVALTGWFRSDPSRVRWLLDVTSRRAVRALGEDLIEPDPLLQAPVVEFLCAISDSLDEETQRRARTYLRQYLRASRGDARALHRRIVEAVSAWWPVTRPTYDDAWRDSAQLLAMVPDALDDDALARLRDYALREPGRLDDLVEDRFVVTAMATERPSLLRELALTYYIEPVPTPTSTDWREERGLVDSEGIRDHAFSNGFTLLGPTKGPFRTLLWTDYREGLALVGGVVDAATERRIDLESSWQADAAGSFKATYEINLNWPGLGNKTFRGTSHVYRWYRGTGVGPYPAMSALMALEAWAIQALAQGVQKTVVVELILGCSSSIAVVALAYGVLIRDLAQVTDELDRFLTHPEIWRLEIDRFVAEVPQPPSGERNAVPSRMYQPAQVAMELVLRADVARRAQLAALGRSMVERYVAERHASTGTGNLDLLAVRRYAAFLDVDTYVARPEGEGVVVEAAVPDEIQVPLTQASSFARHSLEVSTLTYRAVNALERGEIDFDIEHLLAKVEELADEAAAFDDTQRSITTTELRAAACALAIVHDAGSATHACEQFVIAAAGTPTRGLEPYGVIADSLWSVGADRSAARAMPTLIVRRAAAGHLDEPFRSAVLALASNPYTEVRRLFATSLATVLTGDCGANGHGLVIECLREILGWSGLGPREQGSRDRARLPEPLVESIQSTDIALSMRAAADVISALDVAARSACRHGAEALSLLDALIGRDLLTRPAMAQTERGRSVDGQPEMLAVVGRRIVEGDDELLERYLAAFETAPQSLAGTLSAIASAAGDEASWRRIVVLWPGLAGLLATSVTDRRARYRQREEFAEALLPVPDNVAVRPAILEPLREWAAAWATRFASSPELVDRLIAFFDAQDRGPGPREVASIRLLVGNRVERAAERSRHLVRWLARPFETSAPSRWTTELREARDLIDELAAVGDLNAIRVQREIEA
jgi:hypothetical protein